MIGALTGFSLNHVLSGMSLPSGSGLENQLGISGMAALNSTQIYNDRWDDEDAVGAGQGDDWEDEVNRELEEEEEDDPAVKMEVESPGAMPQKKKRIRVVRRQVERPKTVYERFPAFEKDKVLDFSELFKGYAVQKSRISKRPFHGMHRPLYCTCIFARANAYDHQVETWYPRRKEVPRNFLETVVGNTRRQRQTKHAADAVASGSVDDDLRRALQVCRLVSSTSSIIVFNCHRSAEQPRILSQSP